MFLPFNLHSSFKYTKKYHDSVILRCISLSFLWFVYFCFSHKQSDRQRWCLLIQHRQVCLPFLDVGKFPIVSLIFLRGAGGLSFWPLFLCINEKQRRNKTARDNCTFFAQVETLNSNDWVSPQLTQPRANPCLFTSFHWLCVHLCHPFIFLFILSERTFKHTFLTADSNMLQKMGNCLKLPVLRVRSSMSE